MKVYDYGENLAIKRMQSKKEFKEQGANVIISIVKIADEKKFLIELPVCQKVFYCDSYKLRNGCVIAKEKGEKGYFLINLKTGQVSNINDYEVFEDKTIVSLENSKRRFLNENGEVCAEEVGRGEFLLRLNEELNVSFVDENGCVCENDETFIDYQNRVRAGRSKTRDGIFTALDFKTGQKVYYNFLGEKIDIKNPIIIQVYKDLYKVYKGRKKVSDLPDSYLLIKQVYNFLCAFVAEKHMDKMAKREHGLMDKHGEKSTDLIKYERAMNELRMRHESATMIAIENDLMLQQSK